MSTQPHPPISIRYLCGCLASSIMGMTLVLFFAMLMRSLPERWENSTAYTSPSWTGRQKVTQDSACLKTAHTHAHTHTHTNTHICTHTHTNMHTHTNTHTNMHTRTNTHTQTRTHNVSLTSTEPLISFAHFHFMHLTVHISMVCQTTFYVVRHLMCTSNMCS